MQIWHTRYDDEHRLRVTIDMDRILGVWLEGVEAYFTHFHRLNEQPYFLQRGNCS